MNADALPAATEPIQPESPEPGLVTEQTELFEARFTAPTEPDARAGFSDPAFSRNKALPIHRWVPWVAGYASEFVRDVLAQHLPTPGVVLDPFAGVGTTLVEAALLGHEVVGFEINPYAALASRAKLNALHLDADAILDATQRLRAFYVGHVSNGYTPLSQPPAGFKTRVGFYSPVVLRKVLIVQDFIRASPEGPLRETLQLAFAATMVQYSNYSYEPSLGTRQGAGKANIEDADVIAPIEAKLREMAADVRWLHETRHAPLVEHRVVSASFFDAPEHVEPAFADVLITSPPYLNNYHYIRNTRPHLYWLGFVEVPHDTRPLEQQNFGKYWQTVRDGQPVPLAFDLPTSDLEAKLDRLRGLNAEKGIYGGAGWANYAATYFNDCFRFAEATRYALKLGGSAFVVVGNSILQGINVEVDRYLGQIAEAAGLECVGISVPRETRVGNSIIQSDVRVAKAKAGHALYEAVVHLRRPT